jgi:LEA14-like dessication related protein
VAKRSRLLGTLVLTLAASISLKACSSVPRRLAPPQANLLGLSIIETSPEGQLFALRLQLVNPNMAEIPVVRLDFDIRLGGEGRLIGDHATPFTLPGMGSETLEFEVFSELVFSASRLMAFVQGPDNALAYEFHGELVLEATHRDPIEIFRRGQVPLIIDTESQ